MRKLSRFIAIGAIAALPVSIAATTAIAQTPSQYQPYAPQQPAPQIVVTKLTAGLTGKVSKLKFDKLLGTKANTISVSLAGPGTYELKITGKLPGKKAKTLTRGKLVVAAGSTATSGKIKLKVTKDGKTFKKSKKKLKGKTVAVSVVATYTAPGGKPVSLTKKAKVKK